MESSDITRLHASRIAEIFIKEEFDDAALLQLLSVSTCHDMLKSNGVLLTFGVTQRIVDMLIAMAKREM